MEAKKYWYKDNWYGDIYEFQTFRDAKKAALKEDGISIAVHFGSKIFRIVPASGRIHA